MGTYSDGRSVEIDPLTHLPRVNAILSSDFRSSYTPERPRIMAFLTLSPTTLLSVYVDSGATLSVISPRALRAMQLRYLTSNGDGDSIVLADGKTRV